MSEARETAKFIKHTVSFPVCSYAQYPYFEVETTAYLFRIFPHFCAIDKKCISRMRKRLAGSFVRISENVFPPFFCLPPFFAQLIQFFLGSPTEYFTALKKGNRRIEFIEILNWRFLQP